MEGARSVGSIRLAELMAALSLATDLGLGQPLQHEVGVCLASLEALGDDARAAARPAWRSPPSIPNAWRHNPPGGAAP